MRRHLSLLVAGATALALMLGVVPAVQTAQAEYFEYFSTVDIDPITGISSVDNNGTDNVTLNTSAGDTINLTGMFSAVSPFHYSGLGGGSDVSFGQINVTNNDQNPASAARDVSFNFTYTITISDFAQAAAGDPPIGLGTVEVSGVLSGSIGRGRGFSLSNLQNYAINPADGHLNIGGAQYIVTLLPFGPPTPGVAGSFSANVAVVPEPVSMISMALGFLGVGGFLVRNRRWNRTAVAA